MRHAKRGNHGKIFREAVKEVLLMLGKRREVKMFEQWKNKVKKLKTW